MSIKLFLIAAALTLLAGCSLLDTVSDDRNQLAVQYATAKVIDGAPAKAQRVADLVAEARDYVADGATVSIARLDSEARQRIDWQRLDPADRILVDAVLTSARERLQFEIGEGVLNAEQRLQLSAVLDWIEAAARGYTRTQP